MSELPTGVVPPPPPPPPGWPYPSRPVAPAISAKATARPGFNTLAVATLVVGVIPWLGAVAIFIGIAALNRIKVTGERGRVLAIIGLTFGGLWAVNLALYALAGSR